MSKERYAVFTLAWHCVWAAWREGERSVLVYRRAEESNRTVVHGEITLRMGDEMTPENAAAALAAHGYAVRTWAWQERPEKPCGSACPEREYRQPQPGDYAKVTDSGTEKKFRVVEVQDAGTSVLMVGPDGMEDYCFRRSRDGRYHFGVGVEVTFEPPYAEWEKKAQRLDALHAYMKKLLFETMSHTQNTDAKRAAIAALAQGLHFAETGLEAEGARDSFDRFCEGLDDEFIAFMEA